METDTTEAVDVNDLLEKPLTDSDIVINSKIDNEDKLEAIECLENVDNKESNTDKAKISDADVVDVNNDGKDTKESENMQVDEPEINRNGETEECPVQNNPEVMDSINNSENDKIDSLETTPKDKSTENVPEANLTCSENINEQEKSSETIETPMETDNNSSEKDGNHSGSESGEDCASDLEKAAETSKTPENEQIEEDIEPEIESLDEIHLKICNKEEEQLCYACKKKKSVKFCFTKTSDETNEDIQYVCADKCFARLEKHCNVIHSADYFDKKLNIVEEAVAKFNRKCKQCLREISSDNGTCSWESMDFCQEYCLYRYQLKFTKKCSECDKKVEYHQLGKYSVRFGSIIRQFCSGACLDTRKKKIRLCSFCQLAMSSLAVPVIALNQKFFCTLLCRDKYIQLTAPTKPPYIPDKENTSCFICTDKKKELTKEFVYQATSYYFCGDDCLTIFRLLHNFKDTSGQCHNCWKYAMRSQLEAYGMFYDGVFNLFCSITCQFIHIIAHRKIMPCVWCKVKKYNFDLIHRTGLLGGVVYGCSLNCFNQLKAALNKVARKVQVCGNCAGETIGCEITTQGGVLKGFCSSKCVAEYQAKCRKRESRNEAEQIPQITNVCSLSTQANEKTLIFIHDEELPEVANKMLQVRPMTTSIGTQNSKEKEDREAQTDFEEELRMRAVPVPIFVPQPLHMWNVPLPRAVPFPLPVPLPILMPLTRDSSTEYLKTMKKEPVQTPRDPFESELLMMAELVAAEKPKEEIEEPEENVDDFSPEQSEAFNDDVLQMALKMASDYQESAVDLEGALQANTITPGQHAMELTSSEEIIHTEPLTGVVRGATRGRGRGRGSRGPRGGTSSRRGRGRPPANPAVPMPEPTPPIPAEPVEKPDAHMCLKYTFGVNAWKQWVTTKNTELERSSRKLKLFKTDLLQMTADELNYSLCLFVIEVRKPNGTEYAPDTIYYLCLGIQQYLYECGRIDNIFCDSYYDGFTDCLDDVCGKFSSLYSDSHYIVTRVEEEHLWESKQLGAHSPFVLLTTLMFFNTKHFNLTTVEEHMQLSFSHIMKHWKRNPGQGSSRQMPVGGRNVLLRFYPPQNAQANARKKKVYEQQENEDNPLRCPVKLYEFYLSKCPESVKTRNDVFYLLPERSCVPESPVWYSTMALDLRALNKMLHRVKMVKEINVALLTH